MQSLDDIMSGRGEPVSEATTPAPVENPAAEPAQDDTGAARDEKGRFAAKQPNAAAEPPVGEQQPQQPSGHVPIQALDAERNKRKELEDRYERKMQELEQRLAALSQPQKPAEPPKPPPEIWEDPNAFIEHQLTPFQQQMQEMRETLWETQATARHGVDKIEAAKAAAEALGDPSQKAALHREITAGGNPFDNLVKWHERQSVLTEIGDPEAYKAKLRAEILAELQQNPAQPSPAAPPAAAPLPTAFAKGPSPGPRGGPEYGGPRPLADIMKR